ncbi:MAG: GNAT family N-acetyltransferase [Anaerolineaceae bacterium]|nr:GNAT family N-acetyltransferase [Anaerolineaceae bacterium]
MGTAMPVLETERLRIRPFIMDDVSFIGPVRSVDDAAENRAYVAGCIAMSEHLASLYQPPYGDRAVVRKSDDRLIGIVGLVPMLFPFDQYPYRSNGKQPQTVQPTSAEVGLYWEIDPACRQQGYATEAGQALIDYVFNHLNLGRIVANTDYDNRASQGVMRKLGMTLEHNPLPEPEWVQMLGILENMQKETQS